MRCTTCGNDAPEDSAHCPSCGNALAPVAATGWQAEDQGGWAPPRPPAPPAGTWGQPEQQGGFGPPPVQGGYAPPQVQGGFGPPPGQGGFGPPPSVNPPGYASAGAPPQGGYGGYPTPPPAWDGGAPIGAQTGTLAGWWRRVGATVIDGILLGLVNEVLRLIGGAGLGVAGGLIIACVYYGVLFSRQGASVGMMAVGTQCVREQGGGFLAPWPAIGRYLIGALLGITVIGGILDLLWPLWDAKNQTLHDKVVHTLVVRTG